MPCVMELLSSIMDYDMQANWKIKTGVRWEKHEWKGISCTCIVAVIYQQSCFPGCVCFFAFCLPWPSSQRNWLLGLNQRCSSALCVSRGNSLGALNVSLTWLQHPEKQFCLLQAHFLCFKTIHLSFLYLFMSYGYCFLIHLWCFVRIYLCTKLLI